MNALTTKAFRALKGFIVPRHHHIGDEHNPVSAMEKHIVDDAKHVFEETDRFGMASLFDRHRRGFKFGI